MEVQPGKPLLVTLTSHVGAKLVQVLAALFSSLLAHLGKQETTVRVVGPLPATIWNTLPLAPQ